jgi:hypothetical protein
MGHINNITLSRYENAFVIQILEPYVEYEVSIRAMNLVGKSSGYVTGKTKTEPKVKFIKYIILFSL